LIDNALSPQLADLLCQANHDAVHVRDYNMQDAPDGAIFDFAQEESRCLISADTDFGTLLALRQQTEPSVILLQRPSQSRSAEQAQLLLSNLPAISEAILQGSIISVEETRIRVRSLPIGNNG
jgi:predicted nuclease of predicted toxin-antitoxin system